MELRIFFLVVFIVFELLFLDMVEVVVCVGYSYVGLCLVLVIVEEYYYLLLVDVGLCWWILVWLCDSGVCMLDVEILCLCLDICVGEFVVVLEVGVEFGVCYVLVVGNDDDEWCSVDNFVVLCDLVWLFGFDLYLEFMFWIGICDLWQVVWVVEVVVWDNVGLLLDVFYFDCLVSSLEDLWVILFVCLGYV